MKISNGTAIALGSIFSVSSSLAYSADPKVSFYGLIDVYAAATKAEGAGSDNMNYVVNSSGFTTSFVGANTKIDLGNKLTGTAVVESFLSPDAGKAGRFAGDGFFSRNAFVGLSGDFGAVNMGRITTPYFISTITSNPFGGSFGFGPSIKHSFLGGLAGDSGWSNAIQYNSPSINGLKASVLYSTGEVASEAGINKINGSVFYSAGKLSGTISYQSVDMKADDSSASEDDTQTATMLGVSYDLGIAKLFGQYFMMKSDFVSGDTDYDTFQVGASAPLGKAKVMASVAHTEMEADTDSSRTTYALAYDYFFTKKLDVYVVAYMNDVDAGIGTSAALGGRVRF